MKNLFFAFVIGILFSCGNNSTEQQNGAGDTTFYGENKSDEKKSDGVTDNGNANTDEQSKNSNTVPAGIDSLLPKIDTTGNAARLEAMQKVKIEIKTFRNKDMSGYGYEIILDGHTYVHQPNIPAVPGNNGFATEEKAKKVAELVAYKIRNNIMPPTVEVKELDSLGVR